MAIELVSNFNYLGVIIDEHLKWHLQIASVQKKLRCTSFVLNRLSFCSNGHVLKCVYFSLAESLLRYGIAAWGSSTHCTQLQRSQTGLLRILKKSKVTGDFFNIEAIFKLTLINEFYTSAEYRNRIDHPHGTRRKVEGRYKVPLFTNFYGVT